MKASFDRKGNNENLDVWYGCHRYRTKSLKEYIEYLTFLLDEVLIATAHVCRDIRVLEGRR